MTKTLTYISAFLLLLSCNHKTQEKVSSEEVIREKQFETIENLKWLVGNWTHFTKKEKSYENWILANDSTLIAHSFTLVENDTVFAERVTLQQIDKNVFFTVVAYNQNDDKPVTFELIPSTTGTFTFENAQHDFPSKITYTNPVKDAIHAWIEGTVNGEDQKIDFYYKRN